MKKIFFIFSLLFVTHIYVEEIVYEAGNELVSKKRTTPAVLFHKKNDLIRVLQKKTFQRNQLHYGRAFSSERHVYRIEKGDRIRLLESLRHGEIFKVQLMKDGPEGTYYYFIESKNLKHLVLSDTEPALSK